MMIYPLTRAKKILNEVNTFIYFSSKDSNTRSEAVVIICILTFIGISFKCIYSMTIKWHLSVICY